MGNALIFTLLIISMMGLLRATPIDSAVVSENAVASSISLNTDIEMEAMKTLGYQVAHQTAAFPSDKFAMPEPYSSEQLVIYSLRVR